MAKRATRKIKHKKRTNHSLSTISYQGDINVPTEIELIQYDKSTLNIRSLSPKAKLFDELKPDKVNWFKTVGISDAEYINKLCRSCGLHGFDVRDLLSDQQIVKFTVYDGVTFILMPGFVFGANEEFGIFQVGFILGKNYIISIQETTMPIFNDLEKAIKDDNINTTLRQNTPDFLLYILMNEINLFNLNTISRMEDMLLDIEDMLMTHNDSLEILNELRQHRVSYIKMKRALLSIREEYNNLGHNDNKLIREKNMVYINDFDDKLRTTLSDLEICHELLSSLLDLYYSNTNLRMNEIMKRLTIVSTIFIPLTFLVGVWGMNFKFMPELEWKYGYFLSWGVFAIVCVFVIFAMKRKKWF